MSKSHVTCGNFKYFQQIIQTKRLHSISLHVFELFFRIDPFLCIQKPKKEDHWNHAAASKFRPPKIKAACGPSGFVKI